jgi:putative transcriptional regulator
MPIINHVPELVKKKKFPYKRRINLRKVEHETGLEYSTCARWVKNQIERVDFPVLEVWCKYLDCGVGELLEYEPEGDR